MSSSDAYNALKAGKQEWETFRGKAFRNGRGGDLTSGRIDLRSVDLSYMNLSNFDLSHVDFGSIDGSFPTLLSGTKLSQAYLFGSRFCGTRLCGADLSGANIGGAEFESVTFDENSSLRNAKGDQGTVFRKCILNGVDFSGADLSGVDFSDSLLHEANLSGVRFVSARLGGTSWHGTVIDESTCLERAIFPSHPVGDDQSESMVIPFRVNWQTIRWIGNFKIFPLSLAGLSCCFVFFPFVSFLPAVSQNIHLALFSAYFASFCFLFAGSCLYYLRCPEEVREFSAAEWVHLAKNPRPVYTSKSLQGRGYVVVSLILVVTGLLLLLTALRTTLLWLP